MPVRPAAPRVPSLGSSRDYDYIEARLLAPATDLLDGMARLRAVGAADAADYLMAGLQELTDRCRAVRANMGHRPGPGR